LAVGYRSHAGCPGFRRLLPKRSGQHKHLDQKDEIKEGDTHDREDDERSKQKRNLEIAVGDQL